MGRLQLAEEGGGGLTVCEGAMRVDEVLCVYVARELRGEWRR